MKIVFLLSLLALLVTADLCRCVFTPAATTEAMLGALNYVCGAKEGICKPISPGGEAFWPDNLVDHAAWAIDAWFQLHRDVPSLSCNFNKIATVLCENCTCTFYQNTTEQGMADALSFVCGNSNCSAIQPGGKHFEPNTIENHASWAIDHWYHQQPWAMETCDFGKQAYLQPSRCTPFNPEQF